MQHEPTTLVNPHAPVTQPTGSAALPIGLGTLGALLVIGAVVLLARRQRRRMDPRELAFRTIVRRMGYSRRQIRTLRQSAMKSGLSSPVGIVMSPSMTARLLSPDR